MNHPEIIQELERNQKVFEGLLKGLTKEAYLWQPLPEKWCLLEIVCHLYDEEKEDFGYRTRHVLETPAEPFPSIDPQGWVLERNYKEQPFEVILSRFLTERERSIAWLKSLSSPNWSQFYDHPKFGPMTAQMFLSNWLAHDYLHIRQIIRLKFDYLKHLSKETLGYAGEW